MALERTSAISRILSWWLRELGTVEREGFVSSSLTSFCIILATTTVFFYVIWTRRKNKVPGLPPGPWGLPLLGNLPFLGSELHRCFSKLAETHGPIMRIYLGTKLYVVVTSPAVAKDVLKDHDAIFANHSKTAASNALTYGGQDIVWLPYGPGWRVLRKVCVQELLNAGSIDALSALRRCVVRRTAGEVYRRAGRKVEVGEVMFLTSLDLIASMLWGSRMEGEERDAVGREFREVVAGSMELLGVLNISDLIPVLAPFDLQGVGRRMRVFSSRFDVLIDGFVGKRLGGGGDGSGGGGGGGGGREERRGKDFLQVMMELLERNDPQAPLDLNNVKAVCIDMVVGGTDTTSTTVEWAMAELMHHPEIMRRAQEELDGIVGSSAVPEESHLPKLNYLDAVVKETLRLHPALPLLVPRYSTAPCTVGGYKLPAGANVYINAWAIHRDPSIWENSLEFKPERFLKGSNSSSHKWDYHGGNNFHYLPFGFGRRICVGISLAERMIMYMLATLLHSFDWKLSEEAEAVDFSDKYGLILKMAKPLVLVPIPRLSNPQLYV